MLGMQEKADAAFKATQQEVLNIVTDVRKQYPEFTKALEPYYYLIRDFNMVFLNLAEKSFLFTLGKLAELQGLVRNKLEFTCTNKFTSVWICFLRWSLMHLESLKRLERH